MAGERGSARQGLWRQWVLAGAVGSVVVLAVGLVLEKAAPAASVWYWAVGVYAGGASVGVLQWLVLRRHLSQSEWWILASAVGWVVGRIGASWARFPHSAGWCIGASLGILQWLFLRRKVLRSGWWIPASTVAWGLGWAGGAAVSRAVSSEVRSAAAGAAGEALGSVLQGALVGAVTGPMLVRLLQRPVPPAKGRRKSR